MPARQPVRRKQQPRRRPGSSPVRAQARPAAGAVEAAEAEQETAQPAARTTRQPAAVSATRMAFAARAAELARLDVVYLRHDLRNIGIIAGLMLAIIIALSFVLH
jgi:hypothetical protein